MSWNVRVISGSLMLCLACVLVMSDEPQPSREAPADAKKAEAKPEAAKKAGEKDEKKKAGAPAGYEDAPVAGARPAARRGARPGLPAHALTVEDVVAAGDFDRILEAKVDNDVLNLERQLLPQFTPLMTAELSFIYRACDLDLEQRKKIKAASDTGLKAAVRMYAMSQRGMMIGWEGRATPTVPDPNELVHRALATILKETLRPEQQAVYEREIAARAAYRKRVAIHNMVAILDERLVLSAEQRRQLVESLDKNWQGGWAQSLEILMNNNQYLPNLPDQIVVPVLNETQKQVWRSSQKHSMMVWSSFNWARQGIGLDDFPLVEAEIVVEEASQE